MIYDDVLRLWVFYKQTGSLIKTCMPYVDVSVTSRVDELYLEYIKQCVEGNDDVDFLKEYFIKTLKSQISTNEFWALKDVSFNVKKGEALGLIGLNGSGKSTMLKIIAGVLKPTKGSVTVQGEVAPLIELGAGFDFDLTAGENIFLNGSLMGRSHEVMEAHYDEIIEFAELKDFVDVPVKNFSSGMVSRLAFAIATIGTPDILICDEVLSVGDFRFQEKCQVRIQEMLDKGTTLLFVSHSIEQVEKLCNKVVWLEKGNVRMFGECKEIAEIYKESY